MGADSLPVQIENTIAFMLPASRPRPASIAAAVRHLRPKAFLYRPDHNAPNSFLSSISFCFRSGIEKWTITFANVLSSSIKAAPKILG